ncbi:unnamed protein product [Kuraishia capsulata CBS 1993]|uniref:Uncharacterized protein n=1 Tax=Kuraishia capsulata CBS 1993 TaxID=1382522 RepID=W6MTW8_9ASCO|nr:uncharacterized protein KUCA_T00004701001 [Kuraishia capsulata CBS 1993]CDK28717.1 unnamed protein product [Kuraishia capsulata CBS 1993]
MTSLITGYLQDAGLDYAVDKWNDFAGDHMQTKDPYVEELPDGSKRKRKLPEGATKEEIKLWKKIQKRAWLDDKCFMGCYPVDCGIGLGPLVILLPGIGSILMYLVHSKLIRMAQRGIDLDGKTIAKMEANIAFDFLISLPPVIGSLLTWLNGCSTRNAAIVHTQLRRRIEMRAKLATDPFQVVSNEYQGYNQPGSPDMAHVNAPQKTHQAFNGWTRSKQYNNNNTLGTGQHSGVYE